MKVGASKSTHMHVDNPAGQRAEQDRHPYTQCTATTLAIHAVHSHNPRHALTRSAQPQPSPCPARSCSPWNAPPSVCRTIRAPHRLSSFSPCSCPPRALPSLTFIEIFSRVLSSSPVQWFCPVTLPFADLFLGRTVSDHSALSCLAAIQLYRGQCSHVQCTEGARCGAEAGAGGK